MFGMRSLFFNILPQAMMLIGLAGMAWMVARGANPFRHVLDWGKVRIGVEAARKIASERGVRVAEKALRMAKILAMRLEQFFSAGLERIAAHKRGADATGSFWKSVRERKIILRKSSRRSPLPPQDNLVTPIAGNDEVLARFAKEREEERSGQSPDVPA
jgi:hypothetical protein